MWHCGNSKIPAWKSDLLCVVSYERSLRETLAMSSYLSTSRTHTAHNYIGIMELLGQLIIRNDLYCSIASRSYVVLALMCKLEPKLLHQMQLPKVKYRRKGKYCEREEKLQFARILTNLTEFKIFDCML